LICSKRKNKTVCLLRGPSVCAKEALWVLVRANVWCVAYYIGINPLKKLLNKAWDLQISAACSGWNFGFRTYAVIADFFDMPWLEEKVDSSLYRPANVQFLRTLHEGTLEELFKLFRDGLATPFLKDQHGNTLLHVSIPL
jgi:hypothetical protein